MHSTRVDTRVCICKDPCGGSQKPFIMVPLCKEPGGMICEGDLLYTFFTFIFFCFKKIRFGLFSNTWLALLFNAQMRVD